MGLNAIFTIMFGSSQFENSHVCVFINVTVNILHFLNELRTDRDPLLRNAVKLFDVDNATILQEADQITAYM